MINFFPLSSDCSIGMNCDCIVRDFSLVCGPAVKVVGCASCFVKANNGAVAYGFGVSFSVILVDAAVWVNCDVIEIYKVDFAENCEGKVAFSICVAHKNKEAKDWQGDSDSTDANAARFFENNY